MDREEEDCLAYLSFFFFFVVVLFFFLAPLCIIQDGSGSDNDGNRLYRAFIRIVTTTNDFPRFSFLSENDTYSILVRATYIVDLSFSLSLFYSEEKGKSSTHTHMPIRFSKKKKPRTSNDSLSTHLRSYCSYYSHIHRCI